jgi:hypothetical protein
LISTTIKIQINGRGIGYNRGKLRCSRAGENRREKQRKEKRTDRLTRASSTSALKEKVKSSGTITRS